MEGLVFLPLKTQLKDSNKEDAKIIIQNPQFEFDTQLKIKKSV